MLTPAIPESQAPPECRQSRRRTRRGSNTPLERDTRSSQRTIQSPVLPCSPQELSTNDPSLLQVHSRAAKSTDCSFTSPEHAESSLNAQKRIILKSLQNSKQGALNAEPSVNGIAAQQLADLVDGTVTRAEGNSCLLLGPRSSGKSKVRTCTFTNIPHRTH